jgi:hypothetical protein
MSPCQVHSGLQVTYIRSNAGLRFKDLLLLQRVFNIGLHIVNLLLTILAELEWAVSRTLAMFNAVGHRTAVSRFLR